MNSILLLTIFKRFFFNVIFLNGLSLNKHAKIIPMDIQMLFTQSASFL